MSHKSISVIVVLSFLLIPQCIVNPKEAHSTGPFEIKISSDKEEYLTREPILVRYEIKNLTDSSIGLALSDLNEYFSILDDSGRERVNNHLAVDYFFPPDTLKPRQTLHGGQEIANRYQIREAGEYSCSIHFGGSNSNILRILIKIPQGDERKASDMLLEADSLAFCRLGFLMYQELADRYPNSVYAPLALAGAIRVYQYSDCEAMKKVIPVCRRLIENYPNSIYFMSAFTTMVEAYQIMKDKSGAKATMNSLIKKHPNTIISEEAKRRLEQIKKWKF